MKNLKQLYESICRVAMTKPEGSDWYNTWSKIMGMYPFEIVLKAWDNITQDTEITKWEYLQINTWVKKCDYLAQLAKNEEKNQKMAAHEPLDPDDLRQVAQWKKNHELFVTGQITRQQYVLNARKIGQMTEEEMLERIKYWAESKMPLNGHCSNVINLNVMDSPA